MSVVIDWIGGNCPVQANGTLDGYPFYFRARGEHWTMTIANSKDTPMDDLWSGYEEAWHYGEDYGDSQFAAGWMSEDEARAFLQKAAELFMKDKDAQ